MDNHDRASAAGRVIKDGGSDTQALVVRESAQRSEEGQDSPRPVAKESLAERASVRDAAPTPLVVLAVGAAVALSSCGNLITTEIVGKVGISVDTEGNPVVVVAVCDGYLDQVEISQGREGLAEDETNPLVGTWDAAGQHTGVSELDLAAPGSDWQTRTPVSLEPGVLYIVTAHQVGADVQASQVDFDVGDLRGLEPGYVYTGSGPRAGGA